jgi:hypothetical protein
LVKPAKPSQSVSRRRLSLPGRPAGGRASGLGVDTRRKDLDYDLLRKLYRDWRQVSACYLGDYYPLTPYSRTVDVSQETHDR